MMNFINRFMRLFRRRTVNIGRDVQLLGNTVIGCDCSFSAMGHRTKRILRIERKEYQTY